MRRQQLRTTLNVKLQQRLAMTPSLLQKIELLTLNRLELSELLQQELAENPVLEEQQERTEMASTADDQAADSPESDEAERSRRRVRLRVFLRRATWLPSYQRSQVEIPDDRPSFESFLASSVSLPDHLNWQLNLLELDAELSEISYYLVGNINADGYLTISLEEIVESLGIEEALAQQAIEIVQSLDPTGIGCRDLQECLLLQVRGAGLAGSLSETLVKDHLALLQAKRYLEISKRLACELEEIRDALETLRQFTPRPGTAILLSRSGLHRARCFHREGRGRVPDSGRRRWDAEAEAQPSLSGAAEATGGCQGHQELYQGSNARRLGVAEEHRPERADDLSSL